MTTPGRRRALGRRCPDLLDSTPFDRHFVAEVDDDGRAILRFGDGEYGRAARRDVVSLRAVYRVGNGRAGNVGAEALAHAAPRRRPAPWIVRSATRSRRRAASTPETIEEVRQLAPEAFRAEQFRAVTEADWARGRAERLPEVPGAVATFRWTAAGTRCSSASTRSTAPTSSTCPNGRTRLQPAFERRVRAFLTRFRLAGYDLELRPPRFVPLELELEVCAAPGHFRTDVAEAVRDALSAHVLPRRHARLLPPVELHLRPAGLPQPALRRGRARRGRRLGGRHAASSATARPPAASWSAACCRSAPWEIARLDNDPSFVEHGVLTVIGKGGKG